MEIIEEFKAIYSMQLMMLIVGIGIVLLYYDSSELYNKKLLRECKVAKILGKVYIYGGLLVYVALKVVIKWTE